MITKISTADMSREDWLAERKHSIGGSEMGAILGLNFYESPYSVWANKMGLTSDDEDNEAMRQGRDLEEYVAQRFAEKSGLKVRRENAIIRNDAFPHIHANIDRRITGEHAGLECKTASVLSAKRYQNGEFPESYYAQCVTYMAVCEFKRWYLAVLIFGRDFKIYQLTRIKNDTCPDWCESSVYVDDSEIDALRQSAVDFWSYIERQTPPPVDGTKPTADALVKIFPESNGEEIELFGREKVFQEYGNITGRIEDLELQKGVLKQIIMDDMGETERAFCGDYAVSWKTHRRETFDIKAFAAANPDIDLSKYFKISSYRAFKVKENNHGS